MGNAGGSSRLLDHNDITEIWGGRPVQAHVRLVSAGTVTACLEETPMILFFYPALTDSF